MSESTPSKPIPEGDIGNKPPEMPISLLSEILHSQSLRGDLPTTLESSISASSFPEGEVPSVQGPKKTREPISFSTFMKLIGAILFVVIIFFGSFLAYIVFHPDQASFFINIFGINPSDIANLLKNLINGSFGVTIFILSIFWIISLFRAIWTTKTLKRKKLLSSLMAGLIGIILFTILSLWGYLFSIINATDYTNPGGSILIYNNELYADTEVRQYAQISNGANLIGPITLLFDLRSNAAQIMKKNSVSIKGFMIDSDGGVCNDGGSIVSGSNVITEKSIICTFDKIKTYNITGTYTIMNRSGEEQNVAMGIDPIEIRGLISITKSKNIQGKNIITLDAGSLKKIANPQWIYLPSGKIAPSSSITEILTTIPTYVCLRLLTMNCDHLFVLEDTDAGNVDGSISSIQDNVDPLLYHLSISGSSIDANQITNVEWLVYNDKGSQTVICTGGGDTCDYRFTSYGIQSIRAVMILANMKKIPLEGEVSVREPLKLKKNMKVMDANGSILNTQDTYQADLKAYVIENTLTPPADLTLDARDITLSNDGYSLKSVVWKISNGKKTEEQRGEKISITLNEPLRYTIEAYYTFQRTNTLEVETAKDSVIIDIERKSLMPRLDISIDSDYVPSLVTVDASQSQSENGEIKKFIFNFGDGKDPAVGDAIQKYEYVTPGDKEISVTIISESGERATIKKTIVLKDVAKTIDFTPSLSSGIVGAPVDFETIDTNGQIEDYIWSFGDNTATLRGNNTTHIFTKPGVYLISLTVIYTDGTRKTESKKFEVTSGG